MEIVQEIGAYAGLAAVVGLAVLSALYFSQARDVRRLREWAGRAPERSPEAAPRAQPARVTPQPRRTGPIRPGSPPVRPGQARPAQTGAGPATAVGGAAAGGAAAGAAAGAGAAGPSSPAARTAAGGTEAPPADADQEDGGTGDEEALAPAAAAGEDADATQVAPPPGQDGAPPASDTGDEEQLEDEGLAGEEEDQDLEAAPSNGSPEGDRPSPPVPPARPSSPTLPPRPPARLPARSAPPARTAGGHTEVIPPSQRTQPWYRRDPRLAVLAVAGVLIVGGAAVFGLTKIGEEGGGQQSSENASSNGSNGSDRPARKRSAPVTPSSVTVSVLNGTNIPGLAAQIGDEVEAKGFQLGNVTNASDQGVRNESVVFYARGAEREAIAVGRGLDISQREPIDARTQSLAGDARVVVVAGSDKTR